MCVCVLGFAVPGSHIFLALRLSLRLSVAWEALAWLLLRRPRGGGRHARPRRDAIPEHLHVEGLALLIPRAAVPALRKGRAGSTRKQEYLSMILQVCPDVDKK